MVNPTVLIIEDDAAVRETLVRILERGGLQIVAAANGDEAVVLARERLPHVVVADFNMPRMNGVDAVRAIRRATRLLDLPALIISGTPVPEVVNAVDRLGCARFFSKPFLFGDLVKAIRDLCSAPAP